MISLLLLVLLLFGILIGLKRGFILQAFHLVGFIVSFVIATLYYDKLSPKLSLWIPYPELSSDSSWAIFLQSLPLEAAFYNAISFAVIFFAAKFILQIIASMLDFVAELPILSMFNRLFGAILGFLEVYLILFVILFILALTPVDNIQSWIDSSFVAKGMIEHTPYLSGKIESLWFIDLDDMFSGLF